MRPQAQSKPICSDCSIEVNSLLTAGHPYSEALTLIKTSSTSCAFGNNVGKSNDESQDWKQKRLF
jgi:hypothetical protein